MSPQLHNRLTRWHSGMMYGVCVASTLFILTTLVLVVGYLVSIGWSSLSWEFFTAVPTGRTDDPGGMKHALVGTAILVGLAGSIGIPVGMLAGVYLAEYDVGARIANPVRFHAD